MADRPEDFEARMDLETLERADEIRKSTARMDRVRRFAQREKQRIDRVAGKEPVRRINNSAQRSGIGRRGTKAK